MIDIFLHMNIALTAIGLVALAVELLVKIKKRKSKEYIESRFKEIE